MPGVTEQEIAQAKQMNLYQYMQLCEPDNFKPEGPGQFRHKGHSSLTFAEDGSWTYFKTKATGRTALNYLIAVEGVSFVEAVREINRIQGGVRPSFQPVKTPPPPAEKKTAKEFRLPKPDKNNYAATAYLRKRCIHPNVLTFCKQKRILYQTSFKDHPNCVFVGRDGNGEPKGGSLRGCSQIQFRRDIPGSKKIYPFYIEAAANADTVEVYEAPIDAMSGASLKIMQHTGNWRGVHYLALGGTDYAALDAFLTYYPNIRYTNAKHPQQIYSCKTYNAFGKHHCSQHRIEYDTLTSLVLHKIRECAAAALMDGEAVADRLTGNCEAEQKGQREALERALAKDEERIETLEKMVLRLYEDMVAGRITENNFDLLLAKTQKEQAELKEKAAEARKRLDDEARLAVDAREWVESIQEYRDITELDAATLNRLIKEIVVHETVDSDKTRHISIEIHFNLKPLPEVEQVTG